MKKVIFIGFSAIIVIFLKYTLNIENTLLWNFFITINSTLALTYLAINYAKKKGFLDKPSIRKIHKKPTPSVGGLVFVPLAILSWVFKLDDFDEKTIALITSVLFMYFLGAIDDRRPISFRIKLPLQVLASIIVIHFWNFIPLDFGGAFGIHSVNNIWGWILMIAFFQFTINAVNYMDGINGLLGGYFVVIFSFLYFWSGAIEEPAVSYLLASFVATLCAFLFFNFRRKAKTFMGDSGSTVLGLIAATATTRIIQIVPETSVSIGNIDTMIPAFFIFVVIFWYPVFDSLQVYTRRILRGNSPFIADRLHVHHWLMLKTNKNHLLSSLIIIGYTAALVFGMSLSL